MPETPTPVAIAVMVVVAAVCLYVIFRLVMESVERAYNGIDLRTDDVKYDTQEAAMERARTAGIEAGIVAFDELGKSHNR